MKQLISPDTVPTVQAMLTQWVAFKEYLTLAFGDTPPAPEDEQSFLEIKSNIARAMRSLGERLKEARLDYGEKAMRDILNKCVSVGHIKALPNNDKRALLKEWHGGFVRLSRISGAVALISTGYVPRAHRQAAAASKKKAGGSGAMVWWIVGAVVVIGLAVGGYFAYQYFNG